MSTMMTLANVQMPVTLQTIWLVDKKIEGKMSREIVGLFSQNMKFNIFCNGHENILNDIMGYNLLPTMGVAKEMDPHGV
jgi:hypothetical protein